MNNQVGTSIKPFIDRGIAGRLLEPFARMRNNMDHLIDEFPTSWSNFQLGGVPAVEMKEQESDYLITIEVPGISPAAIDLQVDRDMLIVKGEKKEEHEEKEADYVISERSYGAFERRIALPADAQVDKVEASSENGVLKITIPRSPDATSRRRVIKIKSSQKT